MFIRMRLWQLSITNLHTRLVFLTPSLIGSINERIFLVTNWPAVNWTELVSLNLPIAHLPAVLCTLTGSRLNSRIRSYWWNKCIITLRNEWAEMKQIKTRKDMLKISQITWNRHAITLLWSTNVGICLRQKYSMQYTRVLGMFIKLKVPKCSLLT